MYDANLSYEENYKEGPFPLLTKEKKFPKIIYSEKPRFEFLGIPLHIPFGVPAGPMLNSNFVKVALNAGFCLPTYKTVRSKFWKSNDWPNVLSIQAKSSSLFADRKNKVQASYFKEEDYFKKDISISNSFGVPSQTPEIWGKDFNSLSSYSSLLGSHVVLSFQASASAASSEEEAQKLLFEDAKKTCAFAMDVVKATGFCLIEINLSCPNEKHMPIYRHIPSAIKLLSCVYEIIKNNPKIKLIVKIGSMAKENARLFLEEAGNYIDGISVINTVSADILASDGSSILGSKSISGGVCGALIFEEGLRMASMFAELRDKIGFKKQDLALIGVGGVTNAGQFHAYLDVGMDVVQAATGMMWNLNLAQEVANSLGVSYTLLEN